MLVGMCVLKCKHNLRCENLFLIKIIFLVFAQDFIKWLYLTCNSEAAEVFKTMVNQKNGKKIVRSWEIEGWNHLALIYPRNSKKLFDIFDKILEENV